MSDLTHTTPNTACVAATQPQSSRTFFTVFAIVATALATLFGLTAPMAAAQFDHLSGAAVVAVQNAENYSDIPTALLAK